MLDVGGGSQPAFSYIKQSTGRSINCTVLETEKLINKVKSGKNTSTLIRPLADVENAAIQDLEKKIASQLNTKVYVRHTKKKGKIVIEYYGNDDLQRILEKLQLD